VSRFRGRAGPGPPHGACSRRHPRHCVPLSKPLPFPLPFPSLVTLPRCSDRVFAHYAAAKRRVCRTLTRVKWTLPLQAPLKARLALKAAHYSELRGRVTKAIKYYALAHTTLAAMVPTATVRAGARGGGGGGAVAPTHPSIQPSIHPACATPRIPPVNCVIIVSRAVSCRAWCRPCRFPR